MVWACKLEPIGLQGRTHGGQDRVGGPNRDFGDQGAVADMELGGPERNGAERGAPGRNGAHRSPAPEPVGAEQVCKRPVI